MKKLVHPLLFLVGMASAIEAVAQSDIAGPTGHEGFSNTGYFVGWDHQTTFPLNIRHFRFDRPIVFSTNPGNGNNPQPTVSTNRMWIAAGPDGWVGIGLSNSVNSLTASSHAFLL